MKLALGMIVKDEVEQVENILKSYSNYFDEIQITVTHPSRKEELYKVISDNGGTPSYFEWVDDFAAARNYNMSLCKADYIFRLDADDTISNPQNIRTAFGQYILDPRGNILRGLAEVFCDLDQSFKSHERVGIGVKGLPKRVIITGFGGYHSHHGWAKLKDVVNAIASFRSEALLTEWEIRDALKKDGRHFLAARGFELRLFDNGNGH
jgi:glycosyltransferase involved in cell wall biosynthesis